MSPFAVKTLTLAVLQVCVYSSAASAVTIDFSGIPADDSKLTNLNFEGTIYSDSLAPDPAGSHSDNTINVTATAAGKPLGIVAGGYITSASDRSDVTGNTVATTGGAITGHVFGGFTNGNGNVTGNAVTIAAGVVLGSTANDETTITGGHSTGAGDVSGNSVIATLDAQDFVTHVYGGSSIDGTVSNNKVALNVTDTSREMGRVWGGFSDKSSALGNTILIEGVGVFESVIGGLSFDGNTSGNKVTFNGGTVTNEINGGWTNGSDTAAYDNILTINDGTIDLTQNHSDDGLVGGYSLSGPASRNTLNINGGIVKRNGSLAESIAGGIGRSTDGNNMNIAGGAVEGIVTGGTSELNTTNNTVRVTGGMISNPHATGTSQFAIAGGLQNGLSSNATAVDSANTGNQVIIEGGSVTGSVYGALSLSAKKTQNNSVELHGGVVTGSLVGGVADFKKAMTNVKLTDNTVSLFGGTLIGGVEGGRALVGGVEVTDDSVDTFSGNRLVVGGIVRGDNGASIEFVRNFQDIEFRLTQQMLNGEVLLSTRDVVDLTPDDKQVRITLAGNTGSVSGLGIGDTLTLMDNVTSDNPDIVQGPQTVGRGIAALDVFDLKLIPGGTNGNSQITATLHQTVTNTRAGNVGSGHVAAFLGLSEANIFAATQGMRAFLDTSKGPGHWTVFTVGSSGRSKYDSIEMDGGHGLLGLGNSWMLPKGLLSVAVFGEMAKYSYDSRALQMRSSGDSELAGGGLMGRFHWNNGLYLEAMGRAGRAKFDYASHDFGLPTAVTYSEEAHYTGASFGGGVENTYTGGLKMNAYLKYLYNRLDGVNVKLAGDDVRFGEITTQAGLAGIQVSRSFGSVTPYGIAEVERVVNVKSRNVANGLRMENPEDLGGNTYIGTLGVRYNPASNWGADVKVSGFGGSRKRGYSANLSMEYKF